MIFKKRRIIIALILVGAAIGFYIMLRPSYKLTQIEVQGCPQTFITKIEYWKLGERGVVFAYGKLTEKGIPYNDAIINPEMSGFDSIYQVILSCKDGEIVLYYVAGYFKQIGTGSNISHKRVKVDEFSQLMRKSDNIFLQGF